MTFVFNTKNEGNIFVILWLGTVKMTLNTTKLHNIKFPFAIRHGLL